MKYIEYEELIELIEMDMYQEVEYIYENGGKFQLCGTFGYDLASLFDDLLEELDRPPTSTEYVAEGMKRCKRFWKERTHWSFKKELYRNFTWQSKKLKNACVTRLIRTYKSKMVEYSTICYLKNQKDFLVGENPYVDLWLGVDIVVASPKHDVVSYLHVTTDKSNIMDKESRNGGTWSTSGKGFSRDFSKNHMTLAYSSRKTGSTFYINSIPFLEPDYIDDVIEETFTNPMGEYDVVKGKESFSELRRLDENIKESIDPLGLGNVWINKSAFIAEGFSSSVK